MNLPPDLLHQFRNQFYALAGRLQKGDSIFDDTNDLVQDIIDDLVQDIIDETAIAMLRQEQTRLDAHKARVQDAYQDVIDNKEANKKWHTAESKR